MLLALLQLHKQSAIDAIRNLSAPLRNEKSEIIGHPTPEQIAIRAIKAEALLKEIDGLEFTPQVAESVITSYEAHLKEQETAGDDAE